ncbi:MAG: FKBP-type peptidyl-prolyl cis-trans isomerase [Geobacter sp.]|nr:MAG: FKBP-type peptidyl-prolyl cis-trans isomerase [Geobacter sp.]
MFLIFMIVLGVVLQAAQVVAVEPQALKSQKDQVNYAIGVNLANNLKQQVVQIDQDLLIKGMKDAFAGGELLLTDDELRKSISHYQKAVRQKQGLAAKARMTAAEENRKAGDAFLAENRKKEGVVTLPSGLQYRILKAGDGKRPSGSDSVECNYRATLVNGTEIDSTLRTGKPATFKVNDGAFQGRSEALRLMSVGSKWQIFIPPQLAFGERGRGKDIGPNETLIYEVELLAIK